MLALNLQKDEFIQLDLPFLNFFFFVRVYFDYSMLSNNQTLKIQTYYPNLCLAQYLKKNNEIM